jgi:uncharacterized protein with NRDE domain
LVIAANRDEFLDRPSEGPELWDTPRGVIAAPRDMQAGGTWLGVNGAGVFAALTNRPCADPDARRRSRGLLVIDALGWRRAKEAVERIAIETSKPEAYNPFNLFVADSEDAYLISYDGEARSRRLEPGVYVIGNSDPFAPPTAKLAALGNDVARASRESADQVLEALAGICGSHGGNGDVLGDACVHAGAYGTRSSTLLRLGERPEDDVMQFADGAPCCTQYDDFTPLLRDLRWKSRHAEGVTATRSVS